MLVTQHKIANVQIYDMSSRINIRAIQPTFHKIKYPYKHLLKVNYVENNKIQYEKQLHNYPEFKMDKDNGCEEMVYRSILFFCEKQKIPNNTMVWMRFGITPELLVATLVASFLTRYMPVVR